MSKVFYGLLLGFSKLPMGILYAFSSFIYFLIFFVVGYRKEVVMENLKNSFPEKSEKELKQIRKKFYHNFSDYLAETLKSFSITQKELDKRHTYSNLEVFDECKKEGKDVMMMAGHIFNWEWFLGTVKHLPSKKTAAIYKHIFNDFWNEKMNHLRSRFGSIPIEKDETARFMLKNKSAGDMTYFFIADQSPYKTQIYYDMTFLNQLTPVYSAFDKLAVRLDMAVVFCKTVKLKQGYYHTTFERIYPDKEKFEPNEIIHKFFGKLEDTIKENPDNWLWSHRRWKYKRGTDY